MSSPVGNTFFASLLLPAVWKKTAPVGLAAGLIQAAVNQGEFWLRHEFATGVLIKTVLSPIIILGLAVVSAAAAFRHKEKRIVSS